MLHKGQLYVLIENNKLAELIYATKNWDNRPNFPYVPLAEVGYYGTQPCAFGEIFYQEIPGQHKTSYGSLARFESATDDQILAILNFWSSATWCGTIKDWVDSIEEKCTDLLPSEKERLARLGKISKYWNGHY